jgi:hypothetical protein
LIASLTALMAFGVIIGISAQSAAEGLIKERTGALNIASKRNDPGSDDEAGGQAGANGWDLARNEPRVGKAPAGTTSQVDRPAEMPNATSPREPVAAPVRGRVVFAAPFKSYGPLLIIAHGEYHTVLWGFAQLEVVVDDLVVEGQTLGFIGGQSGAASILHMERRRDGHPINLND